MCISNRKHTENAVVAELLVVGDHDPNRHAADAVSRNLAVLLCNYLGTTTLYHEPLFHYLDPLWGTEISSPRPSITLEPSCVFIIFLIAQATPQP